VRAVASADDLRARTSVDLAPSHLVKSLLSWAPRPRSEELQPVPVVFHTDYGYDNWDSKHRFVMGKFHGVMRRLQAMEQDKPAAFQGRFRVFSDFGPMRRDLVERVHQPQYVEAFCAGTLDAKALRKIGLPWSPELVRRTLVECEGTRQTALLALQHGLACNTGGGTHHAFAAHGSGFTIFNDLAVTAKWLVDEAVVSRVLILDLDVHQGDGTAAIFHGTDQVFTCSFHCASNFPFEKQESDLDVALPDGLADKDYLMELARRLPRLLDEVKPDLVIFDAGVDVHRDDVLGKLELTDQGVFDRDYYVIRVCAALAIPVATVVGGMAFSLSLARW
jgi:acetoin utilization deacetylase AcuC-like enzyme